MGFQKIPAPKFLHRGEVGEGPGGSGGPRRLGGGGRPGGAAGAGAGAAQLERHRAGA